MKMYTYTKKLFDPLEPELKDIEIEDISHSLSLQCRFNGHTNRFYSVAQHCLEVEQLLNYDNYMNERDILLGGLLHDASEAYLTDVPTPLKLQLPIYNIVEERYHDLIRERFEVSLTPADKIQIDQADKVSLSSEVKELVPAGELDCIIPEPDKRIEYIIKQKMKPSKAKKEYMKVFNELY